MRKSSESESGHAIRPKLVRGVGEDEHLEWEKLAEKLKAAKKRRARRTRCSGRTGRGR